MSSRKANLLLAASATTLIMTITAAVGPITLFWSDQTRTQRNCTETQIVTIREVQSLLVDAETGQRGYALTGSEEFLQPYQIAVSQIPNAIANLRRAYKGDFPEEVAKVENLIDHANLTMSHLDVAVKLATSQILDAEEAKIAAKHGKELMDYVRAISKELIFGETQEVAALDDELLAHLRWAVTISAFSFIVSLALGRFIYVSMRKRMQHERNSADSAVLASQQLEESLVKLERRNKEISLLAEVARMFQTKLSQEETLQLASTYCQRSLGSSSGVFYLYRNSADLLIQASSWGPEDQAEERSLHSKDCWAIRIGRLHVVQNTLDLHCAHHSIMRDALQTTDWCVPLIAYGEVLGLLHIRQTGLSPSADSGLQFAEAIAEHTALALANCRLRLVLETQSIKDPLTGLYNRRFMDETLERELARSRRTHSCVSIIMLDLDNFKSLNDMYGHAAGDTVLRAVAALLLRTLRANDIVCRFGGEELIVILPDCTLEGAASQAETIRASLETLSLLEVGQSLRVTASIGVASTDLCGYDGSFLLKAADSALYAAKRSGKNRVNIWLPLSG